MTLAAPIESRWELLGRRPVKALLFLFTDCAVLVLAHAVTMWGLQRWLKIPSSSLEPSGYELFFLPFFALLLYAMEGYGNADLRRPEQELELCVKGLSLAFLGLLGTNFILFKSIAFSRHLIVCWYVVTLVLVVVARFSLRGVYMALWRRGKARQRTLLIGYPERLVKYRQLLDLQRHDAHEILGIIPVGPASGQQQAVLPAMGTLEGWEQVAIGDKVQLVVIDLPSSADSHALVSKLVRRCRELRLEVEVFTDLFSGTGLNIEYDGFSSCFRFSSPSLWSRKLQRFCKQVLDRVIGLVGSIFTMMLIPPLWVVMKLQDGGPLFYRSAFVSRGGHTSYYLKFRSMVVNADELLRTNQELKAAFAKNQKLKKDPRVLPIGRFMRKYSIDEFPQFFSLLTGQLTMVGPRTIRQEEGLRYGALLPKLLSVKPGLTGYWQVMGRQTTSYEERVQMDMFYIDHWSLWLDLVIIAKTFWKVVTAEGAY